MVVVLGHIRPGMHFIHCFLISCARGASRAIYIAIEAAEEIAWAIHDESIPPVLSTDWTSRPYRSFAPWRRSGTIGRYVGLAYQLLLFYIFIRLSYLIYL